MSSKRRKRRHECERKKRYDCVAAANSAAWKARCRSGDQIRAYRCPFGGHWHIGHCSSTPAFNPRQTAKAITVLAQGRGGAERTNP